MYAAPTPSPPSRPRSRDTLYAARLSSPLVIGVGEGEHFLASDPSAIMEHTKKVIYLEDYDVAVITGSNVKVHNLKDEKPTVEPKVELLDYENEEALLGDFPNFMLKEIFEAPATIKPLRWAGLCWIRIWSSSVAWKVCWDS